MEKQDEIRLPHLSSLPDLEQEQAAMEAIDAVNRELGREHLSPAYTTDREALPTADVEEV